MNPGFGMSTSVTADIDYVLSHCKAEYRFNELVLICLGRDQNWQSIKFSISSRAVQRLTALLLSVHESLLDAAIGKEKDYRVEVDLGEEADA